MQVQGAYFARLRRHNEASGGYLLCLMDAAYAPRDHPDHSNLWTKARVETLIDEAEAHMERVRPYPRRDQSLPHFNTEYNFYRQWTAHVQDTIGVLRRLLADDPPTVASHGAIPDELPDSDEDNGSIDTSKICRVSMPVRNQYFVCLNPTY
jgi:hypothetical protein